MKHLKFASIDFATTMLATLSRAGNGINSQPAVVKPKITLRLYDVEGCPYCRLVREALTELDLDAEIYPCPKQGERFRTEVVELGGKAQFPFLLDVNTDTQMYESLHIIDYLFTTYGQRPVPFKWQFGRLQTLGSSVASAVRVGAGTQKKASIAPEQLLELYSFETSPYARIVRERLCELEIPYLLRNSGRTELSEWLLPPVRDIFGIVPNSALENRIRLQAKTGRMAIPYLIDPNQNVDLFDSAKIVDYLQHTYGSQ